MPNRKFYVQIIMIMPKTKETRKRTAYLDKERKRRRKRGRREEGGMGL